jgi:site-specific recombinase XerD
MLLNSTSPAPLDRDNTPALAADMDLAETFALAEKSAATIRAYKSDAAAFDAWCKSRGVRKPLPSSPDLVAAFLAADAASGSKVSTVARRAAAIRFAHRVADMDDPTQHESVRRVMRGIRRTIGMKPEQKAPATAEIVTAMISHTPRTLAGVRDRALLTLGFAGAFRRSELAELNVSDLTFVLDGVRVTIRRSKTDQESMGHEIAIPHGRSLKPVEALRAWLEAAQITDGPVFRPVSRSNNVRGDVRLTADSIARVVKGYAELAGYKRCDFSGHSLRAGFVTTAADYDVSETRIMEVTRHKDSRTVRTYIRRANLFKDAAGKHFL